VLRDKFVNIVPDFKALDTSGGGQKYPGVNFIDVLRAAFTCADPKSAKNTDNLTVFLRFWDLRAQKLLIEC